MRTAVETSLAILRSGIERRGVQLSIEVPDEQAMPPVACAQSDLEQVLLNLLANARDATDHGGTVSIRARPSPEGVSLVVEDTGQGIAPEHLPRVFEPFFSTKASGNGLGLHHLPVHRVGSRRHPGHREHRGRRHARARHDSGRRLAGRADRMTRVRILAVDDEPGMLRAIERVLGAAHDVTISGSSREALARAAAAPPDLAILDIRMPELDGFELMERLTALHPDIDVILMTGSIDDQDEKLVRAIRGAAFYFIQKPFDRDVLRTLVDRCVELRRRREDNRRYVQRLERELDAARTFQQGPASGRGGGRRRRAHLLSPHALVRARRRPVRLRSDRSGGTALLIADVAGHGAAAAMLTAVVKSAFRASEPDGYDPLAVTERVCRSVAAFGEERFVTLIAMQISRRTPVTTGCSRRERGPPARAAVECGRAARAPRRHRPAHLACAAVSRVEPSDRALRARRSRAPLHRRRDRCALP